MAGGSVRGVQAEDGDTLRGKRKVFSFKFSVKSFGEKKRERGELGRL
jgi:hypothetical protein